MEAALRQTPGRPQPLALALAPPPAFAGEGQQLAAEAAPTTAARPMTELTFRDATASDIAALVPLVTSAYRGDASRAGWTTEADFLDGNRIDPDVLRADIERPRSRVVLAARNEIGRAHV